MHVTYSNVEAPPPVEGRGPGEDRGTFGGAREWHNSHVVGQAGEGPARCALSVLGGRASPPPVPPASAWGILAGLIRSYFPYFPRLSFLTIVNVRVD